MRDMSQGGVSVGTMSHKCGRYESGWSRCGNDESQVWEDMSQGGVGVGMMSHKCGKKKEKSSCEVCVNCNTMKVKLAKVFIDNIIVHGRKRPVKRFCVHFDNFNFKFSVGVTRNFWEPELFAESLGK